MNGLRIYVNVEATDLRCGDAVFYSRRSDGPYYRWCYEGIPGQWHSARMHAVEMVRRELCAAPWKGVPESLKASLSEHYLE